MKICQPPTNPPQTRPQKSKLSFLVLKSKLKPNTEVPRLVPISPTRCQHLLLVQMNLEENKVTNFPLLKQSSQIISRNTIQKRKLSLDYVKTVKLTLDTLFKTRNHTWVTGVCQSD